jgi:molybdopterin/thiamine biosynthesis adenylyltransferase
VVDFDRVEQKNTLSQFHGRSTVGKGKVQALSQTMNFLWGVRIEANPHKIVADNADQILSGGDLIVDCLDNGEARRLVQDFAQRTKTPCLHGALAADGGFGQVIWDDYFKVDDEPGEGAATCENGEHLPFIVIVSAYMARAVQIFLDSGRKVGFHVRPEGSSKI